MNVLSISLSTKSCMWVFSLLLPVFAPVLLAYNAPPVFSNSPVVRVFPRSINAQYLNHENYPCRLTVDATAPLLVQ